MKKISALLALALLAGCGGDPPKVAPAPTPPPAPAPKPAEKPQPSKPNMATPLTDVQKAGLKKDFDAARALANQAAALKAEGERIEKAKGRDAANDTLVKAKDLYHKAVEAVSDWTDGDLTGKVTDAQLKDYLGEYVNEVGRWQKAVSDIGKVHKD